MNISARFNVTEILKKRGELLRRVMNMPSSGIGGQAVIEGIMMKNGDKYAVAVRKPDGKIELDIKDCKSITGGNKILELPFIRGIFKFVDSLVTGVKTLTYSAGFYEDEEPEEQTKADRALSRMFGEKAESVIMGATVVISVIIAVALFMMLPLFLADVMAKYIPFISTDEVPVIEGILKIAIFLAYVILISMMEDIQRTFMYHGAEHKCINCIETGNTLTVENVAKSSRFHKRCGTSFMLIVMIISIIFFVFIRSDNTLIRYGLRLLLLPVIAGVSYEFIRLAGRTSNPVVSLLSKPGLWMQRFTTKEPDDQMIEVAIEAVEAVFDWKAYLKENGIELDEPDGLEMYYEEPEEAQFR